MLGQVLKFAHSKRDKDERGMKIQDGATKGLEKEYIMDPAQER